MSTVSPFVARVGISQRSPHLVDLIVRNNPMVSAYRLWLSATLNDAYGTVEDSGLSGSGGTMVMEARANRVGVLVASPSILRRCVFLAEVRKGQTSFVFDPDDYTVSTSPYPDVPSDDAFMFARVQENRLTSGWAAVPHAATKNGDLPIRGPILVVPNAAFFGMGASVLSVAGLAPGGSDCAVGAVPVVDPTVQKPMPMHIVFPRPVGSLVIRNLDSSNTLLVSFGLGQPMFSLDKASETTPTGGGYSVTGITEVVLAQSGAGSGCTFSMEAVIGLQSM